LSAGKNDIWMPLYIGDYLADTMHLNTQQHGAYLLLLFHLWRRGSLPDDDTALAKISGLSTKEWNGTRPVLEPYFKVNAGLWQHNRVERERVRIAERQEKCGARARTAAQRRWDKHAASMSQGLLVDAIPEPQPETDTKAEVHSASRHALFRSILADYWKAKNHTSPEMPWQGRDAKALSDLLAACPHLTEEQFRFMLANRARSPVAHGDRIYLWIGNQCLTMNYMEGLSGPIHFSQYAGREVAMGAARKWSVDDIAGSVAIRCERQLGANASAFGALRQSQVLIGSSSPDGTVQMVATGVYNDNSRGIDCQYETTSTQDLMAVSMLGGVSINALGEGSMAVSVMVARDFVDSPGGSREIRLADFPLTAENWRGYDAGARGQNERFRMRFTNGTQPNAWFALKYCSLFTRPLFSGRTGNGA
jgi:uncharacterized protein YdaU (DUF1376 family)